MNYGYERLNSVYTEGKERKFISISRNKVDKILFVSWIRFDDVTWRGI